jgi:exportin-5
LKAGDIRQSAAAGAELTQPSQPVEAQALGYAVLQHLVGNRWEDFPPADRAQLAAAAYSLLRQAAGGGASWVVRSKASLLLALVMKRSGPEFLEASVAQLVALVGEGAAVHEAVCLVLRYAADEVMLLPEDGLQGDSLRALMASLTKALPQALGFIERALEANFAAVQAGGGAGGGGAREAAAAVQAALGAAASYAEWAPVGKLREAGLVAACGYLLASPDFRDAACAVLRQVAGRKCCAEEAGEAFAAAQAQAAAALDATAARLLAPGAAAELGYEGDADEFGQLLCETMATLGAAHLAAAVPAPEARLQYLQHMLAFAQHPYLPLADKALALWQKLLQDAATAAAAGGSGGGGGGGGGASPSPKPPTPPPAAPLPPEAVVALMELAADQLQQRGPHVPQADDAAPPYFDTFEDYKDFIVAYRFKLSSIAKCAATVLPERALGAAGARLAAAADAVAAAAAAGNAGAALERARVLLESAVMFLESTFKAVWDAPAGQDQAARTASVVAAAEPMLARLLALQPADARLVSAQARGLEAFSKLLAARRDLVPGVVSRLLELLVGSLPLEAHGQLPPPGKPPPGWREGLQARAQLSSELFGALWVLLAGGRAVPAGAPNLCRRQRPVPPPVFFSLRFRPAPDPPPSAPILRCVQWCCSPTRAPAPPLSCPTSRRWRGAPPSCGTPASCAPASATRCRRACWPPPPPARPRCRPPWSSGPWRRCARPGRRPCGRRRSPRRRPSSRTTCRWRPTLARWGWRGWGWASR